MSGFDMDALRDAATRERDELWQPHMPRTVLSALIAVYDAAKTVTEDFYACGGELSATGCEAIDRLDLKLGVFAASSVPNDTP